MKRVFLFFLAACLALMGAATVLAAGPWVDSIPFLFSVIKTDTSKNNTVSVVGNLMTFNFGSGIGGQIYGFQPHSIYTYRDLVQVKNNVQKTIYVWYTLDGGLAELYEADILRLCAEDPSGEMWPQYKPIPIHGGQRSGPISFEFHIPGEQQLMHFSGNLSFHANLDQPEKVEKLPPTGVMRFFPPFLGLLLFAAGLWLIKKVRDVQCV